MLKEEICKLREELNNSIINGDDYSVTYKISVELDQLIAEYYRTELDLRKTKRQNKRKNREEIKS